MKRHNKGAMETVSDTAGDLSALEGSTEDVSAFLALQQHEFATYRISVLSRIFDRLGDRRMLKRRGLSLTDSRVLAHLFVNKHATVRGLALEMHMHRPQISRAMTALVTRGYARKKSDPDDRRSAVFTVTPKGNKFYVEIIANGSFQQRSIIDFLGLERYNEFNETLRLLIDNFGPQDRDIDTPLDD